MIRWLLVFAICHLSSAIFQCQAQNALGKHPSDRVLPALFSGPNGTLNANTLIQGLNQYGTMPGTNTTVFGAGGSAGALTNSESRPVYLTNSLAVRSGFFQQLVTGGNVTNGFNMSQTTPGQLDIDWLRTAGTSFGANLITVRSNGAVQFHGVVSGDGSGLTNLSGGTSGALTNNNALAVSFEDDLTVKGGTLTLGTSSSENVIQAASGQVSFSQSLQALGAFITGRTIIATNFTGNGAGLTNISIAPFGVSATNTFYAVSTNAITIVSNATYSSIVISGSGAVAENIDGTYHYFNTYTLTNSSGTKSVVGTIDGIVITNLARASILVVTNPTYPSISGGNVAAYIGSFSTIGFPMVTPFTDILGNDGGTEITSASVSSVSTNGEAGHPKFHGDGSALGNISINDLNKFGIYGSNNLASPQVVQTMRSNSAVFGNPARSNSTIHLRDGTIWMPTALSWSDTPAVNIYNENKHAGQIVWKGVKGLNENEPQTDAANADGFGKIMGTYYWGGSATYPSGNPWIKITSGNLRLEEGYSWGNGYLGQIHIGNEDHFGRVVINYTPVKNGSQLTTNTMGRGKTLGFATYQSGASGGYQNYAMPGFQARSVPNPQQQGDLYSGELWMYSLVPTAVNGAVSNGWPSGIPVAVIRTNSFDLHKSLSMMESNAITIVTNANAGYNTNQIIVADCDTAGFNVTWYWSSARQGYTNSTVPNASTTALTPVMSGGDFDGLPAITNAGTVLFGAGTVLEANGGTSDAWYDPSVQPTAMSSLYATVDTYHPKFHGDAASLYNIPVNGDGLTVTNVQVTNVNFNLVNPNTGTPFVRVGNWFSFGTTNAEPAMIGFSSTIHGTDRGVAMIGMGVGDVVIDPGYANGRVLQIGNSGNAGAYYYMQYAMLPDATFTNGFSHPLEFRSRSYFSGSARSHYPGIVGVPHYGNTDFAGELVFYARAPHWNLNNKQQTAPNTAGTESFRAGTNGVIAQYPFKGKTYVIETNAISAWPTVPSKPGDAAIVSSNGYPYILLSTNGTGGSATWTRTNQLGW